MGFSSDDVINCLENPKVTSSGFDSLIKFAAQFDERFSPYLEKLKIENKVSDKEYLSIVNNRKKIINRNMFYEEIPTDNFIINLRTGGGNSDSGGGGILVLDD